MGCSRGIKTSRCPHLTNLVVLRSDTTPQFTTMAEQALASGSPQNNPRIPARKEIGEIYRQIWD